MQKPKYEPKKNPRQNKFGNYANFRIWALSMLKDVDLTEYGVKAK